MQLKIVTMHMQKGNQIKVLQTYYYAFQVLDFTWCSFNKVSDYTVRRENTNNPRFKSSRVQ